MLQGVLRRAVGRVASSRVRVAAPSIPARMTPVAALLEAVPRRPAAAVAPHAARLAAAPAAELHIPGAVEEVELDDGEEDELLFQKPTYRPSVVRRKRKHGFLARLKSQGGRKVLQRRKLKGRKFLTVSG